MKSYGFWTSMIENPMNSYGFWPPSSNSPWIPKFFHHFSTQFVASAISRECNESRVLCISIYHLLLLLLCTTIHTCSQDSLLFTTTHPQLATIHHYSQIDRYSQSFAITHDYSPLLTIIHPFTAIHYYSVHFSPLITPIHLYLALLTQNCAFIYSYYYYYYYYSSLFTIIQVFTIMHPNTEN